MRQSNNTACTAHKHDAAPSSSDCVATAMRIRPSKRWDMLSARRKCVKLRAAMSQHIVHNADGVRQVFNAHGSHSETMQLVLLWCLHIEVHAYDVILIRGLWVVSVHRKLDWHTEAKP